MSAPYAPNLDAPGYRRYGIVRRDNAIATIKADAARRGSVHPVAYQNARRILTEEYGHSNADIFALRERAVAR